MNVSGLSVSVDALASAARMVQREWGEEAGYRASIVSGGARVVVLEVTWPRDGSVFYVGSDKWGNTAHGDDVDAVLAGLQVGDEERFRIAVARKLV